MTLMFGPGVRAAGLRGVLKGHLGGRPVGDAWIMPGLFLVEGEVILWEHRYRNAGAHPDFTRIIDHLPHTPRQAVWDGSRAPVAS